MFIIFVHRDKNAHLSWELLVMLTRLCVEKRDGQREKVQIHPGDRGLLR